MRTFLKLILTLAFLVVLNYLWNNYTDNSTVDFPTSDLENISTTIEETKAMLNHQYDYNTFSELPIQVPDQSNLMQHYKTADRQYTFIGTKPPKGWETKFYNLFLKSDKDEAPLNYLIKQLEAQAEELGVLPLELAVAYVQGGIAYDFPKSQQTKFNLQYPYETLYLQKGVCADKSLLLSKLLYLMDYEHLLFEFPKANHLAIGIKVPEGYGNFGTDYCFVETTDYTALASIPDNYVQGIQLTEAPRLIMPDHNGTRAFEEIAAYQARQEALVAKYGQAFKAGTTRQKQLSIDMAAVNTQLDSLKTEHRSLGCALENIKTEEEFDYCQKLTHSINELVQKYNQLVATYNAEAG